MKNKITFRIKKYNFETQKTFFEKDIFDIKNEKIIFKKDNFYTDIFLENEIRIENGMTRFQEIYKKKCSSLSNTCMILTFSILNKEFFNSVEKNNFFNDFYNVINKYFDLLSFIVTEDSLGDILIYIISTAVVKKVFLNHIIERNIEVGRNIEDLQGVLSYNLILGGTKAEKPEFKFANLIFTEINQLGEYNLEYTTSNDNYKYTLDSYRRASIKITEVEKEFNLLLSYMEKDNPKFRPYVLKLLEKNNLNHLKNFLK